MVAIQYEATGKFYWKNYERIPIWDIEVGEDGYETGWRRKKGRCWNTEGIIVEVNIFSNCKRIRKVDLKGNPLSPDHLDNFPTTIFLSFPEPSPAH